MSEHSANYDLGEIQGASRAAARRHGTAASVAQPSALPALAASVALALTLRPADRGLPVQIGPTMMAENGEELTRVMARSQELERTLQRYDVDNRAIDGRTATSAARLEDQLGTLDRQNELLGAIDSGCGANGSDFSMRWWTCT